MPEPTVTRDDVKLPFEALFDVRAMLGRIVDFLPDGDDDGEEEEETDEP